MANSLQASQENLLDDTRRVRVIEDGVDCGRPIGSAVLLDTEDPRKNHGGNGCKI